MLIETFECGPVATNAYLVGDQERGEAIIIDAPFGVTEPILAKAYELELHLIALVNTHGHWDHVAENSPLTRAAHIPLWASRCDEPWLQNPNEQLRLFGLSLQVESVAPARFLKENDEFRVGKLILRVLELPGHCPGHIGIYESRQKILFSGDVLFAGSVGRTDLPGADWETLHFSIVEKLFPLGDNVTVYPGHGPTTTIGQERKTNPFLQ